MTGKRKKVLLAVLLVAGIAAAGIGWELRQRNGRSADTISGNGTVEATEVEVSSKLAGRLLAVAVREGEAVVKGQEIATLETAEIEALAAQARGNLAAAEAARAELAAGTRAEELRRLRAQLQAARDAQAQAQARLDLVAAGTRVEQLEQARAALRQARFAFEDADREAKRVEQLAAAGAVSGREADQAAARRDGAQAALDALAQRLAEAEAGARVEDRRAAEAALAQAVSHVAAAAAAHDLAVAGPRPEAVAAASGRAEAARGALAAAEATLGQARLLAPTDGRVTLRNAEPGEVVTPGFPVVRIADLSRVWLRVYVPEPRIGLVKIGQRATVTVDSWPGRTFPGVVTEIAQEPEFTPKNVQTREERVKLVFGVKVGIDNPGGELKAGMPADAAISLR